MTSEIVVAVIWGLIVAGVGAALTELSPWYHNLKRPVWQPPDWLFGPAWTIILGCASVSLFLGLKHSPDPGSRWLIIGLFIINGILNVAWSPLFFTLRRPDWALAEVPLLWLSVLVPIIVLSPMSRLASWLLVPYLAWVAFAAVLNLAIVRFNRPFGRSVVESRADHR